VFSGRITIRDAVDNLVQYSVASNEYKEVHLTLVEALMSELSSVVDHYGPKELFIFSGLAAGMLREGLFEDREGEVWEKAVLEGM
ncbi:unnamed protein product, partial [Symbiodinium sp. CCMP2456]